MIFVKTCSLDSDKEKGHQKMAFALIGAH